MLLRMGDFFSTILSLFLKNLVALQFLLIFAMGVMLGEKENFFEELSSLGFTSFLFFLLPTGFSIILVYYLTKVFMKKEKNSEEREEAK